MASQMRVRRTNWSEPGVADALIWLAIDDHKGNPRRQHSLPPALYTDVIAPFLHFDEPLPDQLYVLGGRNQQQGPLDTVEMFDTWHGRWVTCPSMALRRAGCGAAALPDNRLIVVGGYDDNGIVKGLLASCEIFDPRAQTWTSDVAPLEHARWGHGCALLGGKVYAVGGCSLRAGAPPRESFMETLRSCEVYDPDTNSWQPCGDLHMARAGSRVVTMGERYLAAVGGCDDVFGRAEMLPTVEIFDTELGRWSLLEARLTAPRTTAAVAVLDGRKLLVVGGAPSLSTSEVYTLHEPGEQLGSEPERSTPFVADIAEGRMGCQAVSINLPAPDGRYPLCNRRCVVIMGGENGEEDFEGNQAHVRQFNSTLVYDAEEREWREDSAFPPMLVPRTAMALCVGHGRIRGYPHLSRAGFRGGC